MLGVGLGAGIGQPGTIVVTWRGLEGEKPFWRGYSFADISSVHFTVWGSILDNLGSFSASGAALRTLLEPSGQQDPSKTRFPSNLSTHLDPILEQFSAFLAVHF